MIANGSRQEAEIVKYRRLPTRIAYDACVVTAALALAALIVADRKAATIIAMQSCLVFCVTFAAATGRKRRELS
jgi:hypothetical protein